jgi:hypothetical protein
MINNLGTKQLDLTMQALDVDGHVVANLASFPPPGGETALDAAADAGFGPRTCRFIFAGSKKKVRTSACVFSTATGCTAAVEGR